MVDWLQQIPDHLKGGSWIIREGCAVSEAPTIIGTCINCLSSGSLSATLALIAIGAGIALTAERRKLARVRADK
jgi:hypothetical protein